MNTGRLQGRVGIVTGAASGIGRATARRLACEGARLLLADIRPADAAMAEVVRVVDFPLAGDGRSLWLNASCIDQRVLCYLR
mgnify:CR=1 FL=1